MIREVSQYPQIRLEKCQYLANCMQEFNSWFAKRSKDYDPVVIPWRDAKHEAGFKASVKRVYKIREQQEEHRRLVKLRAEEKARREEEERLRLEKLKADRLARACILDDEPPPRRKRSKHAVQLSEEHRRSRTKTMNYSFWDSDFLKQQKDQTEEDGSAAGSGVAAIRTSRSKRR